jgi:hypothetical protein
MAVPAFVINQDQIGLAISNDYQTAGVLLLPLVLGKGA